MSSPILDIWISKSGVVNRAGITRSETMRTGKSIGRLILMSAVCVLLLVSCTDSVATTTTDLADIPVPSHDASFEDDVELIVDLWKRQTTAWIPGFDAGIEFWVAHNYPDMGCTFTDYLSSRFPQGPVDGLIVERVADPESVELDEGWRIPGGRLEGDVAKGRVYEVTVESRRFQAGQPTPEPERIELHVTILDGEPYFFLGCS